MHLWKRLRKLIKSGCWRPRKCGRALGSDLVSAQTLGALEGGDGDGFRGEEHVFVFFFRNIQKG